MAYQLIERPHKFSFSYNPARYGFTVSNPDAPGCAIEVELYSIGINVELLPNTDGDLITRQTVWPNPDGTTYFYVEDYLNSYLEWEFPSLASDNILAVTGQIRQYYIRYRQITRSNPSPAWTSDSDTLRIIIKGGIAKDKFDRNNFFVNHLPAKRPFLTWQPAGHFIGTDERRYLTYLHTTVPVAQLTLVARVVYTDGVQENVEKAFPPLDQSLLFHLPAGLQQLGLYALHPDKKVWYYDILVKDEQGNELAAPYRLYADYNQYYKVFSFIYHNSLGGIDTVRVRGDWDVQINRDFTDIQMAIGDTSGEILPTENGVINISQNKTYTGDVGWLQTPALQESLEDMLHSETVYQIIFGRWLKVLHLQKTQAMGGSDDTKWSFPLQWRYTFDNSRFTPFSTDFGAGTTEDPGAPVYGTCTAPGNLQATFVGETADGKEFRLSWDAVGGAEGYELEYLYLVEWYKVPVDTNEKNLVFSLPGAYSWRVRTRCAPGDYSGYAAGPGFSIEVDWGVCTAPDKLEQVLLSIDATTARIRFTWPAADGTTGYIVEWREFGAAAWNTAQTSTTSYAVNVSKDVQYECRVRSICQAGGYSAYRYGPNFIASNMVGTCNPPNGLTAWVSPETYVFVYKAVSLSWNAPANAEGYEVQVRENGIIAWTTYTTTEAALNQMMNKEKSWQWRVRTKCVGGGYSGFINGPDFNT